MAHTQSSPASFRANSAVYVPVLGALVAGAVLLRAALPANFLNLFIEYSTDTGGFFEKIHPGTYAIFAVFALVLTTSRAELDAWSMRAFRALAGFTGLVVLLAVYLIVIGRFGSGGYLIDTYLAAAFGGMTLLLMPPGTRVRTADLILVMLLIGAAIGIFEFLTHTRVFPYPTQEKEFRPTGLAGHPLMLGLLCATAIPFVAASKWRPVLRFGAMALLYLGVAAASARFAMMAASIALVISVLAQPLNARSDAQRTRAKALILVCGAMALAAAITALALGGFLDRFNRGLADASALTRVQAYGLFGLVSWREILFGMPVEQYEALAKRYLGLEIIESSVVEWVLHFGLFVALIYAGGIFLLMRRLTRGLGGLALTGTAVYFLVALSNNTLSTKTASILVLIVLLIGAHARLALPSRRP